MSSKLLLHLLHARHPWRAKKKPGFGPGESQGETVWGYCKRAQLINRTSLDRRSKFLASSASISFVS